ncbi:MAG: hypothetical protein A2Y24_07145 [Clostridiales bacterium GWE2_32_10]|nr:MAG: hypothetical protein A2Y24_07145 [Clostridiales bacterium GWE2_32_10]HBY20491.1 hypothetical protein [Clostridiales bacterium]
MNNTRYLKWHNTIIGIINDKHTVEFTIPNLNTVVQSYTHGKTQWSAEEYKEFLIDRIVSKFRRDIEKILYRCGLVEYDEFKLAEITRAMNPKDLLWIALNEQEKMEDIMKDVFEKIFVKKIDIDGGSVLSPDGVNIKRYGVSNGCYGIYKKRLHPMSTDIESEVAVYELSKLLGVKCCPAWLVPTDDDVEVFSKFEYNFAEEYIVHFRRLFTGDEDRNSEYYSLITKFPKYKENIQKMIILDFITRQTDRHLSNMAQKITNKRNEMYSLYDNGRSLFNDESENMINKAINNIELYSSEFGPVGTYSDAIYDIAKDTDVKKIVNLNISDDRIRNIYKNAGLVGYKLEGGVAWTCEALKLLKGM